ncbi:Holliday junction resolvase RuvX [Listeria fleischmannii]|uniref:Putative pre-16S rRNA nuclease n=2 Tax=Listeria fleischmannii TaxID=1069827 RepID=W7DM51_9LIST|nr:Holliday junction resolvase RuvX [Listeria fleischmannii]EIA19129.1 Holliday junction resolvase-like protein [Listeria fleischmannii subsp. coloradonensis]EUJ55996.1 Holliday junction resolvase-like protein [Listeria fleischmannii FSL S10-1203]MBC1399242.1 Holliday junction resolvase RuvX [Listeria fleischmannii]MBC1427606.1 Holliday junction resolvase RuvX [Listeria fleischmannii]
MRIMGLDVGSKTVGVAISDALGWTAQGIETVAINEDAKQFGYNRIAELASTYEVEKIIVGLPKNMNNTLGPRAESSKKYAEVLQNRTGIEVLLWDERLTTQAAERTLLEADVSRKKRKQVIDKLAAVMILQSYLDANK